MKISDFFDSNAVLLDLASKTKPEVIEELAVKIAAAQTNLNEEKIVEALMERENLCSTALDSGVAVPHAKINGIQNIVMGFARSVDGVPYDSLDNKPSHFFVMMLAPENTTSEHIKLLARISKIFSDRELRAHLMDCSTEQEIYETITIEDEKYSNQ